MNLMFRSGLIAVVTAATILAGASAARADGGTVPSAAPPVELGVPYFGDNTDRSCTSNGCRVDFWRLPPILAGDVVTVAWRWTGSGYGPRMCLTGGIDDFDWYQNPCKLSSAVMGERAGARSQLTSSAAQSVAFLQFTEETPCAFGCNYKGPYQFTVESIQHAVGLSMDPVSSLSPKGTVTGKVRLSDSSPVPDGLPVVLTVRHGSETLVRNATTAGGAVSIPVKLPKAWKGDKVRLSLSTPASTGYLAATTPPVKARIG